MNLIYVLLNKIYTPATAATTLLLRSSQLSVWLIRRVLGESAAARWLVTSQNNTLGGAAVSPTSTPRRPQ